MFDVNKIAQELSDTYKIGLTDKNNNRYVSKLITNNIKKANQWFCASDTVYDENKKFFICKVVAYTTCEIYNKLHDNFKEKQLNRICNKSTHRVCQILKQPLEEDSPENEIMTMVGIVLPFIIKTEAAVEKLRFNPVKIAVFICDIPKQITKFLYFLSDLAQFAREYYKKH